MCELQIYRFFSQNIATIDDYNYSICSYVCMKFFFFYIYLSFLKASRMLYLFFFVRVLQSFFPFEH
jgi:hypothetical protein